MILDILLALVLSNLQKVSFYFSRVMSVWGKKAGEFVGVESSSTHTSLHNWGLLNIS